MNETITMKRTTLISIILVFLGLLLITAVTSLYFSSSLPSPDKNIYYCQDNDLVLHCDSVVNGIICKYIVKETNDTVGKTCKSGWVRISDLEGVGSGI